MATVGEVVWVATTTPSTVYTTLAAVQSIRNRWAAVGLTPASVVRVKAVAEVRVRAYRAPPPMSLVNTARESVALNARPKPAISLLVPANVAWKSSERPWA